MPLSELKTERLVLRPVSASDVDLLYAMWTAPDMRRHLWDDMVVPREMVEHVVESHVILLEPQGIGFWIIHLGQASIGFCGFRFLDDGSEIELLYGIDSSHWGRGYATEASRAAIAYLWEATKFGRVFARTDPPNTASVAVLRRIGMSRLSTTGPMLTFVLVRPSETAP